MRHSPLIALFMLSAGVSAVEAKPEIKPTPPAVGAAPAVAVPAVTAANEKPAAAANTRQPDPTAAIIAEGKYVYRQRDIDALMLIAMRHAKARFNKTEDERLREVLTAALLAREPFLDALAALPGGSAGFSGPEREALILDLLDYQTELAKVPVAPAPAAGADPSVPVAPVTAVPAAPEAGPMLIRLPMLHLTRTLPGVGKRQLNLTIALFFRDPAVAQKLQSRAPLMQDAILSHVQGLSAAQFIEPSQLTLKDGITTAIIAKIPDFPPDAVLIPEMDASAGDGTENPKTKTAP
jgi:hypothetical protein